jgi:drug/metabolite transporter (DMT)-like permease
MRASGRRCAQSAFAPQECVVVLRLSLQTASQPVNTPLGIALKLTSVLAFVAMAALVKLVADRYPLGEVVFFRAFFALVPLLLWLSWGAGLRQALRTGNPIGHARRSIAGSGGMFCGFAALMLLPLPDATAIGYATPLFTTALAAIVLKERVRAHRWSAVAIGLCGVLIMLSPHFGASSLVTGLSGSAALGAMLGLMGAGFAGIASIEVRRLAQTETTGAIVFYFSSISAFFGLTTLLFGWVRPTAMDAAILIAAGIVGGIGQILLTSSLRFAQASVIAPFDYASLIWAMLLGYCLFGDFPAPEVLTGAAIVIVAGLAVIWREHRLAHSLPLPGQVAGASVTSSPSSASVHRI